MMSTLTLNKNSFTVDTSIWESINDCTFADKKEEDWRYMKWGKLKKLEFHGDFPNQTENFSELNLPTLTGPVIVIENGKLNSIKPFPKHKPRPCVFEYIYFARPDSLIGGKCAYEYRKRLGIQLAIAS